MANIRVLRNYSHPAFQVLMLAEAAATFLSAFLGYATRYGYFPPFAQLAPFAITFTVIMALSTFVMGVHEARLREGEIGVLLRSAVAFFLVGAIIMVIVMYLTPTVYETRGVLFYATVEAFVLVTLTRWLFSVWLNEDLIKRRVLVLGAGERAMKIASRLRRRSDRRTFNLVGFLQLKGTVDLVSAYGDSVFDFLPGELQTFCRSHDIDEVVVAMDNRRSNEDGEAVPFDELMGIKLSGIEVCEVQDFVEREVGKLDIDLLRQSWLVFSDGFTNTLWRSLTKRLFDMTAAALLTLILAPVMLITALLIKLTDGLRAPILYRQIRVGIEGKPFELYKFRTMVKDAEESGAVWADHNDPRTTNIGRFLRRSHIDELPQLYNVLIGQMSMVGPRPERPIFVEQLKQEIPLYTERHRIKPGVSGWAQLCYPYGASIFDTKEKLQYDLYYLKNNSFFLDLLILLLTVEKMIVGQGSR
jgi:sugar transferase (PEP-CTERM system associated)